MMSLRKLRRIISIAVVIVTSDRDACDQKSFRQAKCVVNSTACIVLFVPLLLLLPKYDFVKDPH